MSKVPLLCGTYQLSQIEKHKHTDRVLHDTSLLIDIATPDDSNVNTKETENLRKYKETRRLR
jgi:hypothetical protein